MSQKERDFQSKPKRSGQKFGGKGFGRGRPEGQGFGKRFEGDKGERPERSARPYDRDSRPPRRDRDGDSSGSGQRDFGDRDSRPPRSSKPYNGDDRPPRREFGDRDSRPPRSSKPYNRDDRPPRREFGRDEGRRDFKAEGRRDFKAEGRRDFKAEGRRDFGDRDSRPPRDRDSRPPRRDFGDRKPFNKEKRFARPRREFGDSKGFGKKDFSEQRGAPVNSEPRADVRQKLKSDRPSYGAPSSAYLYGIHAVTQALLNSKRLHQRLLCTQKGYAALEEARQAAEAKGITLPSVTYLEKEDIDRLLPRDAVHQDVLLDCQPLEETFLADILISAPENAKVLVLDQVTDPHNVGAILRSASAFGAIAVVMQTLHAPEVTGTLAKSASGAVEHVPLVREVNLSRALEQLKAAGFFCIGLDEEGKQSLSSLSLTGKTALVLGAEGAGLRRLVAENCDELVKLPTQGPIASLNVSNAAAVALYELTRNG